MTKRFRFYSFVVQLVGLFCSVVASAITKSLGMEQFSLGMSFGTFVLIVSIVLTVMGWVDENLM